MAQCTVAGNRELPALPTEELRELKHALDMSSTNTGIHPKNLSSFGK